MCSQSAGHYLINTSRQSVFALKMTSSVQGQPDGSVTGEEFHGCIAFAVGKYFRKETVEEDAEKRASAGLVFEIKSRFMASPRRTEREM